MRESRMAQKQNKKLALIYDFVFCSSCRITTSDIVLGTSHNCYNVINKIRIYQIRPFIKEIWKTLPHGHNYNKLLIRPSHRRLK